MGVKFNVREEEKFSLVEFTVDIAPEELKSIAPPEVPPTKGVIISGRVPICLYAALSYHYNSTLWVATYEPRFGGAVVVESHSREATIGDVIPV